MENYKLRINGKIMEVSAPSDTPLLWVLRDYLNLKGTKFGCGKALCGSCTIHVNHKPIRSCVLPVSEIGEDKIITIEGISSKRRLHPVQKAWLEEDVPQCGYCQTGQIMTAIALLESNPDPSDKDIQIAMSGNICRCGTYLRIKNAIKKASNY